MSGKERRPRRSASIEIDGYTDIETLEEGGFSKVYKAWQPSMKRHVAVKVLDRHIESDGDRRRFENECGIMGALSYHPHIVTVFGAGFTHDDRPYLVMEYYSGGSVAAWMADAGQVSVDAVVDLGVKIATALHTAHEAGISHRDIKPQNIFISQVGEPALGDFGISSVIGERTVTGTRGLTLRYAPPEALGGDGSPDPFRADIYSLAVTLHALLSGSAPFTDPDPLSLTRQILFSDPPRIDRPGVPAAMDAALRRGLAKSPEDRFPTAAEFADALRSVAEDLAAAPHEPSQRGPATSDVGQDEHPAIRGEGSSEPAASAHGDAPTIQRRSPRETPAEPPSEPSPDRRRQRISVVLAVVAIAAVIAVAMLVMGDRPDGTTSLDDQVDTTGEVDSFFQFAPIPTEVAVELTSQTTARVTWTVEDEAAVYEIERRDMDGQDAPIVEVEAPPVDVEISEGTAAVCVVVRAIIGSRISADSTPVCTT